jgi:hypothetical protein
MSFQNKPWDPSPYQNAVMGLVAGWMTATVVETFILDQKDAANCMKQIVLDLATLNLGSGFWNRFILWVVIPLVALYLPLALAPKAWRAILLLGTIALAAVLVMADLQIKVF